MTQENKPEWEEEFLRRFCTPFLLGLIPEEPRLALIDDIQGFIRESIIKEIIEDATTKFKTGIYDAGTIKTSLLMTSVSKSKPVKGPVKEGSEEL